MENFNGPEIRTSSGYSIVDATVGLYYGLVVRPCGQIVRECQKYSGKVFVKNIDEDPRLMNAKSVIDMMTLGACRGKRLKIYIKGTDHEAKTLAKRLYSGITTESTEDDFCHMNFDRFQ